MNMTTKLKTIKLEVFEKLDTTLSIARERLIQPSDTDYAILALEQTNGVGQQGKKWFSPKGNLALSIVLSTYTFCDIGELALIFATSVYKTIISLITEKASYNLKYKYPNDIYLYEKKLGGVLVEVHQNRMIASVGLNLAHAPEEFISMKDYMRQMSHNEISDKKISDQNPNATENNNTQNPPSNSSLETKHNETREKDSQEYKEYNNTYADPLKINPVEFFHLFWEQHQKDIDSIKKEGMDYVYNHWSKNLL